MKFTGSKIYYMFVVQLKIYRGECRNLILEIFEKLFSEFMTSTFVERTSPSLSQASIASYDFVYFLIKLVEVWVGVTLMLHNERIKQFWFHM